MRVPLNQGCCVLLLSACWPIAAGPFCFKAWTTSDIPPYGTVCPPVLRGYFGTPSSQREGALRSLTRLLLSSAARVVFLVIVLIGATYHPYCPGLRRLPYPFLPRFISLLPGALHPLAPLRFFSAEKAKRLKGISAWTTRIGTRIYGSPLRLHWLAERNNIA